MPKTLFPIPSPSRPVFWVVTLPAVLVALVALVSWRVFFLPMAKVMPEMGGYVAAQPLGVWGHVIFGPLALALAPLQLWTGFRSRHPRLHRWSGRLYGLSILLAALSALSLLPVSIASPFARTGFGTLAVLWIATTAIGIMAARQGDFATHRIWMLRSVALTWAAVSLRLIMAPLMASGWTVAETYELTAWGSWLLDLALLELWLWRSRQRGSARA